MKVVTETRPWGNFDQFVKNEQCTVKIITVKNKKRLSLQSHKNRIEHWIILKGTAKVTVNNDEYIMTPYKEIVIEKEEKHRIEAIKGQVKFLEISYGEFDEHDEIRYEDDYGRTD